MNIELYIENEIEIDAPMDKVWNALVNPDETQKYMFGCRVVSDMQKGSPMIWQGELEGKLITFVQGHIVDIDPGKMIAYTAFDPNSDVPDIPENYLTITYSLSEEEAGKTYLIVRQGDYTKVADGQARYDHSEANGGWFALLLMIKELVETGKIEFKENPE